MKALIAGIDEAGRGPVIGPLVVAGVLFDKSILPKLHNLGIKDSKLLSPSKRASFERDILNLATGYKILYFNPSEIDEYVLNRQKLRKLNWLEAKAMAKVIELLHPRITYLDAADTNATRFGLQIQDLVPFSTKIISLHHADRDIPIVSAASILAKVNRDRACAELKEKYGDFGSGYPSDPRTLNFLSNFLKSGIYPDCVRKSWKTLSRIQKTL